MTGIEEKLYLQSVFNAIDEVYQLREHQTESNYEERLRASLKKLVIPHWYNPDYTSSIDHLRKVQSYGQKLFDCPTSSISSFHHRSSSQLYSERKSPITHVSHADRRSNGNISTYAPGLERVTQSSRWYKPESFSSNVIDNKKRQPSSSSNPLKSEGNLRYVPSITMAQQTPLTSSTNEDRTVLATSSSSRASEFSSSGNNHMSLIDQQQIMTGSILPSNLSNENLFQTDSSSYASVTDATISSFSNTTSESFHTAPLTPSSSLISFETPTLQIGSITDDDDDDDRTISSSNSMSNLISAETAHESNADLDIVAISTAATVVVEKEEKPVIISPVVVGMENLSLPTFSSPSSLSGTIADSSSTSPSESRPNDSLHWYDDGSIETTIQQNSPPIHERNSHQIDLNRSDENFSTISPDQNPIDDQVLTSHFHDKPIYTRENPSTNVNDLSNSESNSPIMITNLDDILIDDDDDDDEHPFKDSPDYLSTHNRRPIQEEVLYEVEHENSFSDHSQTASSLIMPDETVRCHHSPRHQTDTSIKIESPADHLTSARYQSDPVSPSTNQNSKTSPMSIPSSSSALHVDTTSPSSYWNFFPYPHSNPSEFTLSTLPCYTSKIRQRHFSVGSYYDHKTTTIAVHPIHPLYFLGSAPVSPLSRTSALSTNEFHYQRHHPTPITYEAIPLNTSRHLDPILDRTSYPLKAVHSPTKTSSIEQHQPIFSFESTKRQTSSTMTNSTPFTVVDQPAPSTEQETILHEPILIRPKTSRGRPRVPSPPEPAPRAPSFDKETETLSTDDDRTTTPHTDLQFIRGTIERVFEFHPESNSESTTLDEEISEDINPVNDDEDEPSISLSESIKTLSNENHPSPVAAVQPVETTSSPSKKKVSIEQDKSNSNVQVTDLDEVDTSQDSSESNPLISRSHPNNQLDKHRSKSKGTDQDLDHSEEIDDTLNDIEDEDSQDDKLRRQATIASEESSPLHSGIEQSKSKKTSQETQTLHRQPQIILTTQTPSPSPSHSRNPTHQLNRSTVPPIDIVTQMVIERGDGYDDGHISEISGDMVIFYDDIEIVEHSSNISSTESDSMSSSSRSYSLKKPAQAPSAPPIPARTLKPLHLLSNTPQPSPSSAPKEQPIVASPIKVNRTYELEKATIRKKIDVNSVNNMLNRKDFTIGPTASHRHPSARHFVGKLNSDESSSRSSSVTGTNAPTKPTPSTMVKSQTLPLNTILSNGKTNPPSKLISNTLPTRSASTVGTVEQRRRPMIADTNALVKQIQNSLSRTSIHDDQIRKPLSVSTKDLRTFVSSTYSPSDENVMDDNGVVHRRPTKSNHDDDDDQSFKRQARLSKSFHNVSEYNTNDEYPKKETNLTSRNPPSKSVENHLHQASRPQPTGQRIARPLVFPPVAASTSFSALPPTDDNNRMLSMKWYTGQVSENSEISYTSPHHDATDMLYGYISTHSNRDVQLLFARLQASNDMRIHAALDDMRSRVLQFDAAKSVQDLHVFMRYLESRLRDLYNKTSSSQGNDQQRRISNGGTLNGHVTAPQDYPETTSMKSRASSTINVSTNRETPPTLPRQYGRQHHRSSGNLEKTEGGGAETNGHAPQAPPRRSSQSSTTNQENPAEFDHMLNTVLGLPKKGGFSQSQIPPSSSSQNRERSTPLAQPQSNSQMSAITTTMDRTGKRLFESGTYKDPRLLYDGPKKDEKEEQALETSV